MTTPWPFTQSVSQVNSPDEVLAVAAERRLLEEPSGEFVIADLDHVLETQRSSTLVPRRHAAQRRAVVAAAVGRVRQSTAGVAAAAAALHSGVHCPRPASNWTRTERSATREDRIQLVDRGPPTTEMTYGCWLARWLAAAVDSHLGSETRSPSWQCKRRRSPVPVPTSPRHAATRKPSIYTQHSDGCRWQGPRHDERLTVWVTAAPTADRSTRRQRGTLTRGWAGCSARPRPQTRSQPARRPGSLFTGVDRRALWCRRVEQLSCSPFPTGLDWTVDIRWEERITAMANPWTDVRRLLSTIKKPKLVCSIKETATLQWLRLLWLAAKVSAHARSLIVPRK